SRHGKGCTNECATRMLAVDIARCQWCSRTRMTRATDIAITPGPELTKLPPELHAPYHQYDKASAVASNPRPRFFTFATFASPPSWTTSRRGGVATTAAARALTGPRFAPRPRFPSWD